MPKTHHITPQVINSGIYWEVITPNKTGFKTTQETTDQKTLNNKRRVAKFKRSVNCNARKWYWPGTTLPHMPLYMVGTFNRDISMSQAKKELSLFIKRTNYHIFNSKKGQLKYHHGGEFMVNGRPHFNILLYNVPFIHKYRTVFRQLWNNGRISVEPVKGVQDVARYVAKYFTKDYHTTAMGKSQRLYTSAHGLHKPNKIYGDDAKEIINDLRKDKAEYEFKTRYMQYEKYKVTSPQKISQFLSILNSTVPPHFSSSLITSRGSHKSLPRQQSG